MNEEETAEFNLDWEKISDRQYCDGISATAEGSLRILLTIFGERYGRLNLKKAQPSIHCTVFRAFVGLLEKKYFGETNQVAFKKRLLEYWNYSKFKSYNQFCIFLTDSANGKITFSGDGSISQSGSKDGGLPSSSGQENLEPYNRGKHPFTMDEAYQALKDFNNSEKSHAVTDDDDYLEYVSKDDWGGKTKRPTKDPYSLNWNQFKRIACQKYAHISWKDARRALISVFGRKYDLLSCKVPTIGIHEKNFSIFLAILEKYYFGSSKKYVFKKQMLTDWNNVTLSGLEDMQQLLQKALAKGYSLPCESIPNHPKQNSPAPKAKILWNKQKENSSSRNGSDPRYKPGQSLEYYEKFLDGDKKKQ